jgi:hypothetical protein
MRRSTAAASRHVKNAARSAVFLLMSSDAVLSGRCGTVTTTAMLRLQQRQHGALMGDGSRRLQAESGRANEKERNNEPFFYVIGGSYGYFIPNFMSELKKLYLWSTSFVVS